MSQARIVTIVFLIALEILTIKSNVNAAAIKNDPNKLDGVLKEVKDSDKESENDTVKMINVKHNDTLQSVVPIETTAKTEEIQKNMTESTSTATIKPQLVTTMNSNLVKGFTARDNAFSRTPVDFLLNSTETVGTESTRKTSTPSVNAHEITERNNTSSYSTEAVQAVTLTRSDKSSTTQIDDDRHSNTPKVTELTTSTPTQSTYSEPTASSTLPDFSSDTPALLKGILDKKPISWKKYTTIDRKRSNTTAKENKLATAETKYQNTVKNDDLVFTTNLPFLFKHEISSTESISSASPDSENITDSIIPLTNELYATTEDVTEYKNSSEKTNPFSNNFTKSISPLTEELNVTEEAVTEFKNSAESVSHSDVTSKSITEIPISTISSKLLSTADVSEYPKTIDHKIDQISTTSTYATAYNSKEPVYPPSDSTLTSEAISDSTISAASVVSENLSTFEAKTDQIPSTSDLSASRTPRAYVTETEKSADALRTTNKITSDITKGVLTSKRAGYLDMSAKPTSRSENTTAEVRSTARATAEDAKKTTSAEPGSTDRKVYYMQSQSQLVEDAINEELMKEEMMSDQLGYTQQNREQRKDKDNPATEKVSTTDNDDHLSVKPIGADKQKNTGLYTVSPNYKPMKKIEVQPPKPFVRDPDDNSWRNESLSSLGIVFKANNSSKPLTQVLKNKTETEFNALLENNSKSDEPELRTRLEKIAEQRKTKKKVVEKIGENVYGDSDDKVNYSVESSTMSIQELEKFENDIPSVSPLQKSNVYISSTTERPDTFVTSTLSLRDRGDPSQAGSVTTAVPRKNNYESIDGSEEEPDYSILSNIDIKKSQVKSKTASSSTPVGVTQTTLPPERKATVQYFPPTQKDQPTQKVNVGDYDYNFQGRVQALEHDFVRVSPLAYSNSPTSSVKHEGPSTKSEQNLRLSSPVVTEVSRLPSTSVFPQPPANALAETQDGFDGATYVIKHLRDFIHMAAKESDEDRAAYLTEPPRPSGAVTAHSYLKDNKVMPSDYDEYPSHFRKEVLDKFVDNFNQNSEQFKVHFPVLYNTSIIHGDFGGDRPASSSAFMRRAYGREGEVCDHPPVELAPEYELHYYVPEQEERDVAPSDHPLLPVRYRLRI